ncbi:MAG TPA: hypothetical protein VD927_13430 [Chryseosolibacter sp.]|nr:hypothetical protein [Chryseosolibacter sp.]
MKNLIIFVLVVLLALIVQFANAQSFSIAMNAEKTVSGTQYGPALSFQTKSNWRAGAFYQSVMNVRPERGEIKSEFYGISAAAPLKKCDGFVFYATFRAGLSNNQFLVLVPGIETEIRLTPRASVAFGTSIRMQHVAASGKLMFRIFNNSSL